MQVEGRSVATVCIYAAAVGFAVLQPRPLPWMTVSDIFFAIAAFALIPSLKQLRLPTTVSRVYAVAIALMVAGGCLGTVFADDSRTSAGNVVRLAVGAGVVYVIVLAWSPTRLELRRVLLLLVVPGLVSGAWALAHSSQHLGRPEGFSGHSNHLAIIALISLAPAVGFAFAGSATAIRMVGGAASVFLVAVIIVSGSRSGLVGLFGEIAVAVFLFRFAASRRTLLVVGGTAILLAAASFTVLGHQNAISRLFDPSPATTAEANAGREVLYHQMIADIKARPLTGVGFADPLSGHDAYLQLWAAGGLLAFAGGILLLGGTAAALITSRRCGHVSDDLSADWPLAVSTLALSGILADLAFQNALWVRHIWFVVALVAASSIVADRERRKQPAVGDQPGSVAARA